MKLFINGILQKNKSNKDFIADFAHLSPDVSKFRCKLHHGSRSYKDRMEPTFSSITLGTSREDELNENEYRYIILAMANRMPGYLRYLEYLWIDLDQRLEGEIIESPT